VYTVKDATSFRGEIAVFAEANVIGKATRTDEEVILWSLPQIVI
jgi:hypothetical protein